MADGPIRRACNRCHAQKLSCKRLGNEPCERCVRLKAECKSSPSLRFRKSSNSNNGSSGSSNGGSKTANRHNIPFINEQHAQKHTDIKMDYSYDLSSAQVPYPGPYSFDSMSEHLWQSHSVDAGLLMYYADENQIHQSSRPSRIPSYNGGDAIVGDGCFSARTDVSSTSYQPTALHPSTVVPAIDQMTTSWPLQDEPFASWNTESWSTADMEQLLHGMRDGIGYASTVPLFSTLFVDHDGNRNHNHNILANMVPSSPVRFNTERSTQKGTGLPSLGARTVSNDLFSELCTMSAQLLEMKNVVSVVRESQSAIAKTDNGTMMTSAVYQQGRQHHSFEEQSVHQLNGSTHGGVRLSSASSDSEPSNQCFPMDELFALSRHFLQTLHNACRPEADESLPTFHDHASTANGDRSQRSRLSGNTVNNCASAMAETGSNWVDAESFVAMASSIYTALLDVYQGVFDLVGTVASRPKSQSHASNGAYRTKERMQRQAHTAAIHSWEESVALSCFGVCRFPDVSVGGFPVASTPALQLGLGLRLADDFLAHFSHAVATLHKSLLTAGEDGMVADLGSSLSSSIDSCMTQSQPPLVVSENFLVGGGTDATVGWDTVTSTSASSSSTPEMQFSLRGGNMAGVPSMVNIAARELHLRQELADLRSSLSS